MAADNKIRFHLLALLSTLLVIFAVAATYHRVFVRGDYLIEFSVPCDPTLESCFAASCDAGECYPPYKIVLRSAASAREACGETVDGCESLVCEAEEVACEVLYCDAENGEDCEPSSIEEPFDTVSVEAINE